MRIMITGSTTPAAAALIHQLTGTGHELIGVDSALAHDPALTAAVHVPPPSDRTRLRHLLRLAADHRIDALIPTAGEELPHIAAAPKLFAEQFVVIGAAQPVLHAHDSYLTMTELAQAGVPVPRFGLAGRYRSPDKMLRAMGGTAVIKPRFGGQQGDVTVVRRPDDVDWGRYDDSFLVQEYIAGTEYVPMVYAPLVSEEPSGCYVVEKAVIGPVRVRHPTALPNSAPDLVWQAALRASIALELRGPIEFNVRLRPDGSPVVLDARARFGEHSRLAPELLAGVLADASAFKSRLEQTAWATV